jgi:GNAT superfamily N-acetyltransferase
MQDERIRQVDEVEAAACRAMFAAAPADRAAEVGMRASEVDGATVLVAPGFPGVMFNRVVGLGVSREATQAALDGIQGRYRESGVGAWCIQLNPCAQPAALGAWLQARGFSRGRSWAKMWRAADAPLVPAECDLEIRPARPAEHAAAALAICEAFSMGPAMAAIMGAAAGTADWHLVVAVARDEIAGGGFLFHDRQRRAGWLGAGGVRPSWQRHGAQRAFMNARIALAASLGCDYVVTETGEPVGDEPNPSLNNMRRCGFEKVMSRPNWVAPQATG